MLLEPIETEKLFPVFLYFDSKGLVILILIIIIIVITIINVPLMIIIIMIMLDYDYDYDYVLFKKRARVYYQV